MIDLVREEVAVEDAIQQRHQWPVKFTATYTDGGLPAKIFVMKASPDVGLYADSLSCIANAIQMTDLPEDAPAPGSPFYRVGVVTKLCRSATAAEEFVEKVKEAVQDLVNNLDSAENLSVIETVTIVPDA
jgi:hypothetical protein